MKVLRIIDMWLAKGVVVLIRIYQKTLSFDHAWYGKYFPHRGCRFHPSCSEYGVQVLQKKGFIKGVGKAFWRFLRCNPWNEGGIDKP